MMSSSTSAPVAFARLALSIGLIAMLVVAISAGLRFERQGGHVLNVQTGSMQPTFRPGDAVIAWRVVPRNLRVGDIVSYHSLRDPRVIISHRIIAIHSGQLITRGDASVLVDPAITAQSVIGQVRAVAPDLGRLLGWIKTPIGLTALIYIPACGLIYQQIRRVIRFFRPISYKLYSR